MSCDRIVGTNKWKIESSFSVGLLVEDLSNVEGLLEDQVALRCVVFRSKDKLRCKTAIGHFCVEVRMLSSFLKGTDFKINPSKSLFCLFGSANHAAQLILVILHKARVSIGPVCSGERCI